MNSARCFYLELIEEHEKVNVYSLRFDGVTLSEFEKFVDNFSSVSRLEDDFERVVYYLDKITEKGALERYFRPAEGRFCDNVCALPVESSRLRLYCLRLSDEILIVGNGGEKTTPTYNVDPHLNACVEVLSNLDAWIKSRISKGSIGINGKIISGGLKFFV